MTAPNSTVSDADLAAAIDELDKAQDGRNVLTLSHLRRAALALRELQSLRSLSTGTDAGVRVKEQIEKQAHDCQSYPRWLIGKIEDAMDAAEANDWSTEQVLAYALLSALEQQPAPRTDAGVRVDREQYAIADDWRDLALQFDQHRIECMSMLRYLAASQNANEALGRIGEIKGFLAKPPLSGEAVLAQRLSALEQQPAPRTDAGVRVDREQYAIADDWRDLALQFDQHRIECMSMLRYLAASQNANEALGRIGEIKGFLAKPPLSGEAVLAQRLSALEQQPAASQDKDSPGMGDEALYAWLYPYVCDDGQTRILIGEMRQRFSTPTSKGASSDTDPILAATNLLEANGFIVRHKDNPGGDPDGKGEFSEERINQIAHDLCMDKDLRITIGQMGALTSALTAALTGKGA